ncbi:MAG: uracil-DNA glycosylase family protein [Myxococcota bacterium]
MSIASRVSAAARALRRDVSTLRFAPPVTHVYNPLDYAARAHHAYLRRYAAGPKRVLFLGMNPGPYGMVQTGVPFGEVALVRDWLGIEAEVGRPAREHPKRPVLGFDCPRSEVSGARLWGAIAEHYGEPENFFADHFVANYCPLAFLEASGRNRTPDKLPAAEREPLFAACDRHLRRVVRALEPEWVIGIGVFAARRAREVCGDRELRIASVLHPSPANPRSNRGWAEAVEIELRRLEVCVTRERSRPRGGTRRR